MIRAYNAIIAAVVNTITYSILLVGLISPGQFAESICSGAGTPTIADVTPKIAAQCGRALQRLIERSSQPRKAKRFSQASRRSMLLHDRAQAVFFERGNNNDGRSAFARVQCFQDRHPVYSRVYIQDDGGHVFEILVAKMEKLL